ncbi:peptide chain release factor N(5)-glutamine methyltransferase [Haloplasma contractile]|uniref:Release factor glutamine methyltransferase n=1 Tax=Haloplasma contractile SSD-17B TaxID=1033810 RepID=U2EEB4_9MOLU|nr:peptide chain release factor N(5)-glutamine methyltransferase [Haloplasma contractile]ERJ13328.1 Release factor glutamine methyltransferase protein [Haloplasma contractile SSD-17B]
MTIKELLKYGEQLAQEHDKEETAIKLLLMHYLQQESYQLIMNMNQTVEVKQIDEFKAGVNEYVINNVPVQHIIGHEYFYGYNFIVGPNVLIPRFETEELVANVLAAYDEVFDGKEVNCVDVGTGSGAIAITLSLEEANLNMDATDISEEALVVAKQNAKNLDANVNFLAGDMLQPLIESGKKYDILVSNPPYIPEEEYVEALVKDNEPHVALFGGGDGMKFYRIIMSEAKKILNSKNILAFEHGWNQKEQMETLIKEFYPNSEYEILKDMNGKYRMTIIKNR